MPYSTTIIRMLEDIDPSLRKVLIAILEEIERQREETVTKKEFLEFAHQTEENFQKVWKAIGELTEAQKGAEKRLNRLENTVNELAEAQRKTEQRLNELAEAQRKTEQRLNELAEAQRKTEQRLNELAEAQNRTEEELKKLIGEHRKTRENLGGLQHTVGYVLEDRAYAGLPKLLKDDMGITITEPLRRDYIEVSPERYIEANIIGKARKNGKNLWIIGECKTQLKKKDVDAFLKELKKLDKVIKGEKIPLIVTYQASPPVRKYTEEKGIKLYFSYQMPMLWAIG